MGKPFSNEIQSSPSIFESFDFQPSEIISRFINDEDGNTVIAVGSGGSFSAAVLLCLLCQRVGRAAIAMTPIELSFYRRMIPGSKILFISASGSNNDILYAYDNVIKLAPSGVLNVVMRSSSKLAMRSMNHNITQNLSIPLTSGKDGFLATNSLLAYFSLFVAAFSKRKGKSSYGNFLHKIKLPRTSRLLLDKQTYIVLYGSLSKAIAVDIESKLNEAALGNVALCDYRNFGHGRHHWFALHSQSTLLIALVTNEDRALAEKTIDQMPKEVSSIKLDSRRNDSYNIVELLYKSFLLVDSIGKIKGIDPGRPSIPKFGRKLYHLNYKSFLGEQSSKDALKQLAIRRKLLSAGENIRSVSEKHWAKDYEVFSKKLRSGKFVAIAVDYDGTICSEDNRFIGISPNMSRSINRILKNGFIFCVVTGRGKSVRDDLQKTIDSRYWDSVIIAYYNGSEIGFLEDKSLPDLTREPEVSLVKIHNLIKKDKNLRRLTESTLRPRQLTVELIGESSRHIAKLNLKKVINDSRIIDIKVFESSHSLDIISIRTSKTEAVNFTKIVAQERGLSGEVLCIGDKGKWPGNDYELLRCDYSLSVNEVSDSSDTCWNLAPAGTKNEVATLFYLSNISYLNRYMKINLVNEKRASSEPLE